MLDRDLRLAFAIAEALTVDKSVEELARLQIVLQTISSLVAAELGCLRNGGSTGSTSK